MGRDYQKARESARQILEKKPGHQEALLLMVDTAMTPDDMQETRNLVDKLKARAGRSGGLSSCARRN